MAGRYEIHEGLLPARHGWGRHCGEGLAEGPGQLGGVAQCMDQGIEKAKVACNPLAMEFVVFFRHDQWLTYISRAYDALAWLLFSMTYKAGSHKV